MNVRSRNSAGGTNGSLVCIMRRTNAAIAATAITAAAEHPGVGPALRPCLGQCPRARGQAHDRERCADEVEAAAGMWITGLRYGRVGAGDRDCCHRHVDQECPSPSRSVDQTSADERSDRPGDASQSRPRPDGRGSVGLAKARLQDRQTSGRQQGAADALQHPGCDEHLDVRRRSAQQRGHGEPDRCRSRRPCVARTGHPARRRAGSATPAQRGSRSAPTATR